MALGNLTLRVSGWVYFSEDQRKRRRPIPNADVKLLALADQGAGLQRVVHITNPIQPVVDAHGKFDHLVDWGTLTIPAQNLPEPAAFDVEVTDPASGIRNVVGRIFSNGDSMVIESGIAPDEFPLALALGRPISEVTELAAFLAAGLASPDKLGEVSITRPYLDIDDQRQPTAPEKLFRHFGNLLDRLQAAHLAARRRDPKFDPNNFQLAVPLGFKPLEDAIVSTLGWHPNLSAAERVRKMVASYAAADVTEDVLRRNVARLVTMLGKILVMPIEYRPNGYLWEDMAVILTLFTGIGLVAQRNHIVWADFQSDAATRKLTLSML